LIVKVILSTASLQDPFPVAVNVNVTVPAVTSAALGVYIGVRAFALLNVPVPEVVQVKPPLLLAVGALPEVERSRSSPSQIVSSEPASAVAAGVMVNTIASVASLHEPFPVAVIVNVTVPAVISFAPGV
jgi:hypothetical protein